MVRPRCSRRRNSSQVAHCGTRFELAMSTRGAHSCVRMTPTGLPDWTSMVSSSRSEVSVRTIASNAFQLRAALPVPPYTTRSSGRSATSGSRLFISIRNGASVCQDRAVSVVPRGARTGRAPSMSVLLSAVTGSVLLWAQCREGSEQRAAGGLGGGDERAGLDEFHGGGDVGGEVAVRARSGDPPAQGVAGRGRGRGGGERQAQVERPRGGKDLDRQHLRQGVDGAAQLAGGRPAHRDVVLLHRALDGIESTEAGT